jgi:hypothetical protein
MLREKASLLASVAELDELLAQINSHTNTLKTDCSQNEVNICYFIEIFAKFNYSTVCN